MKGKVMEEIRGYKVFEPDWKCRNKQYSCPGEFEEDVVPNCCNSGMHFCKDLQDCFKYYSFNPDNKVAEVVAYGDIDEEIENSKVCTNKLRIIKEISWEEVLRLVNTGKGDSGLCNSGNRNSGNRNSGDWNSGDWNSGNRNSGNRNSGNCNSGDWNSGDWNSGDWNSGNRNSGNRNSGDCNSGDWNSGNRNSGNRNSGNRNSGDCNSGNRNSGDCNSGDWNSGDWNSGNRNSGDWNKTNFSSGCFNTEEQKITMFNKPSEWTYADWYNSKARYLMNQIDSNVVEWIWSSDMTDEEKLEHPEFETTGGYLKELSNKDCCVNWWHNLNDEDKSIILALPNFDAEIFEEITGIKVNE
jgi:hypothetical protein